MRTNKYHAKRIPTEDGVFDSRKEYRRWQELKVMCAAGYITDLQRQVKFELIPCQREADIIGPKGGHKPGKVIEKAVTYIADFTYTEDGKFVVEDTKGMKTPEYVIKRKLMLWLKGIRIKEV